LAALQLGWRRRQAAGPVVAEAADGADEFFARHDLEGVAEGRCPTDAGRSSSG